MTIHDEEMFIHFGTCMQRLNSAWQTLTAIKAAPESPLINPAFQFALVDYSAPYTRAQGLNKKWHIFSETYIPPTFLDLHKRILDARNKVHAHADLTVLDAKLYVTMTHGKPSAIVSGNYIHGLEELPHIDQIISLIEGTLLNMYADQDNLLRGLQV